jgi:hypothetical protein
MRGVTIRLNCYDLLRSNRVLRRTKMSIYHTSVVFDEKFEIYYGFRLQGVTGIDYASNIDELPKSMSGSLYKSFPLGRTKRSLEYCQDIIKEFTNDARWLSERYNAIYNNCHTFAYLLCEGCLGEGNMHRFPMFIFECDRVSNAIYQAVLRHFIDENNPPYFLGKQLKRQRDLFATHEIEDDLCDAIAQF